MITKPRIGFRIVLGFALLVLICCVPFAGAIDNTTILDNTPGSSDNSSQTIAILSNQALTHDENAKEKIAVLGPFLSYKENMTFWQKKLPTPILEIIDPNAPLSGMTRDEIRTQLILEENLMPADEVYTKLGISQPTGDLVKVTIYLNPSVSTHIIDSYVSYLIGKRGNLIDAWVHLDTIEKIASLNDVISIDLIGPSIHQGDYPSVSPSIKLRDTQPVITPADTPKIPLTTLTSLPVVPSKTNTTASALSFTGIFIALVCSGLLIMMYRRQERRK